MATPFRHVREKNPGAPTHQSDKRFSDTFYDQHKHPTKAPNGRPWWGEREYPAMNGALAGFIGADLTPGDSTLTEDEIRAGKGVWTAPITVEFRFAKIDYERKRVQWMYDKMKAHDEAYYRQYFMAAAKVGHQLTSPVEVEYGVMPRFNITAIIGDPPRNPRVADALMGGHPWLLGFSDEPDDELAELVGFHPSGVPIRRAKREGVVSQETVLNLTQEQLQKMVREAAADIIAADKAARDAKANERKPKPKASTPTAA